MTIPRTICAALTLLALSTTAAPPLVAQDPIPVPDSSGSFDYMTADVQTNRLLANHTANNTLDVFDLSTGKFLQHVKVGQCRGVAIDQKNNKYFVTTGREHKLVVLDRQSLEKKTEIPMAGEGDALTLNPKDGCLYVGEDDGTSVWVVNAASEKLVATIKIPEKPEGVEYDPAADLIYQTFCNDNAIGVIDPATNTISHTWPTAPAAKPHGLALDSARHRLFSAGNGKLAVIDTQTGKLIATVDIAKGVDAIAFDPDLSRIYCASRNGVLSVVEETPEGAKLLADVESNKGAHTLAIDPKTHAVWTCYAETGRNGKCYIRKFTVPK